MKTTIAAIAIGLFAITGCADPTPEGDPVAVESTHHLTEERRQPLSEILAPPTPQTTLPPIGGLLPMTEWQPAPAPWQVDLPDADLPPLSEEE